MNIRTLIRRRAWRVLAMRARYNWRTRFGRRPFGPVTEYERATCRHEVPLEVKAAPSFMQEGEIGADGRARFDPRGELFHWLDVSVRCPRCGMNFEFVGVLGRQLSSTPLKAPACAPGRLEIRLPVQPVVAPRPPAL